MKKAIYIFTLVSLGAFVAFGQKPAVEQKQSKTTDNQTKTAAPKIEREKFNPAANPNDDLQMAIARAQKENKRIVLDVGGEWCGWCREMDNYLIRNAELGKLRDENYIWLKINFSEENENKDFLARFPQIKGYPHLFVLEKDGKFLYSKDIYEPASGKESRRRQLEYRPFANH